MIIKLLQKGSQFITFLLLEQSPESNQVEYEEPPLSDITFAWKKEFLPDDQELDEHIDREEDHIVDNYVGCKIEALYENGWIGGKINYYNKSLGGYHVSYEDKNEDYILLEDTDGAEAPLTWNKHSTHLDYSISLHIAVVYYCICWQQKKKNQDQSDIFLNDNVVAAFQ